MKKLGLILTMVALMFSSNIFAQANTQAQVESVAKDVLQAYKTQDVELLKKHASGILKYSITDSYFKDKEIQEYIGVIKNWDGQIRGIGYEEQNMGPVPILMATVYFADDPNSNDIYEVLLSNANGKGWIMFGSGLAKEGKSKFDKLSKTVPGEKKATPNRQISIEMANGDTFDNSTAQAAISNFEKLDDDNFFIILKKDNDFMQFAYSDKNSYQAEYKENGIQYEAKTPVTKEQAITLIKDYYNTDDKWKTDVEWEKM